MKQTRRMIIAAAAVVGAVAGGALAIANVPVSASQTSESKPVVAGEAILASASTDPERAKLEEQIAKAQLTLAGMQGGGALPTGQAVGGANAVPGSAPVATDPSANPAPSDTWTGASGGGEYTENEEEEDEYEEEEYEEGEYDEDEDEGDEDDD